ncbi:MAG: RNA-directed DNA polymerase [Anaerolineae bacterium]|nr:RNA-directed DNA polymerase [Anaerolineae bacterium]
MIQLPRLMRILFAPPTDTRAHSPGAIKLAHVLKIPVSELPNVKMGRVYHYRPFSIPKKDGRARQILAPSPALKELQQRLLRRHLVFLPVHPAATAFMPGASIVHNAQRHAGQAVVATADLADFFASTSADRVRDFFVRQGWRDQALSALMRLCVYRNGLPQGAPTSPILSNLVNAGIDAALDDLAQRSGATYTRYGDDLCFSWPTEDVPAYFSAVVQRELLAAGYRMQPRKSWRIQRAAERPEITGLVLGRNGRIEPSRRVRVQMRKLRWLSWWRRSDPARQARLRGYDGFLNMLDR